MSEQTVQDASEHAFLRHSGSEHWMKSAAGGFSERRFLFFPQVGQEDSGTASVDEPVSSWTFIEVWAICRVR